MPDQRLREFHERLKPLPFQLPDPVPEIAHHGSFVAVAPEPGEALFEQVSLEQLPVHREEPVHSAQVHPPRKQQPALSPDQFSHPGALAEEFGPAHFVDRPIGVLHDMELVVHDPAVGRPLLNTQPERFPHVDAGSGNPHPLPRAELGPKELIQRLFLSLPPEPYRLDGFQVANHGHELLLLSEEDLVHAHLRQRRFLPRRRPSFQIPEIDGPSGARRQAELTGHLARRGTFTGQPDGVLEALAERRFARQLGHFLNLDPAVRTADPVNLHHNRRAKLHAGKVTDLSLTGVVGVFQLPPATRANQLPVTTLTTYPKLQRLCLLVDFMPVDPIPRPSQQLRQFTVSLTAESTRFSSPSEIQLASTPSYSCAEPNFGRQPKAGESH